jgi:hypothetical protein
MKTHLKPRTAIAMLNRIEQAPGMSISVTDGEMDMLRKPKTKILRIVIDGDNNGDKAKQVFKDAWDALYKK